MTIFPIVERELRVRARGGTTRWARFAFTLLVAFLVLTHFLWQPQSSMSQSGRWAFEWLLGTAFVLACAAFTLTADAISSERRDGTLGLLFLTGLRSWDVTTGKLASTGLGALYAVLALVPMLTVPLLAGGVTPGEAARSGLSVVTTLLLTLTVGLAASARETERLKAMRRAGVCVLAVLLLPLLFSRYGWFGLHLLSPISNVMLAQDANYVRAPAKFWISSTLVLSLAGVFLGWAGILLRRSIRADAQVELVPGASPPAERNVVALQTSRAASRGFDDARPVEWVVARQHGQRALLWTAAALGLWSYAVPLGIRFFPMAGTGGGSLMFFFAGSQSLSWLVTGLFAWAACRFFFQARQTGELELLTTTPIGAHVVVAAHWNAMKRLLRGPVLLMLAPLLLEALASVGWGAPGYYSLFFLLYPILRGGELLLGLLALNWLGMLFGLTLRRQINAVVLAVVLIEVLPMLLNQLLRTMVALWGIPSGAAFQFLLWPAGYYAIHYGLLLLLTNWAKLRLRRADFGQPLRLDWRREVKDLARGFAGCIRFARQWKSL